VTVSPPGFPEKIRYGLQVKKGIFGVLWISERFIKYLIGFPCAGEENGNLINAPGTVYDQLIIKARSPCTVF
jgi:hypothetical protein